MPWPLFTHHTSFDQDKIEWTLWTLPTHHLDRLNDPWDQCMTKTSVWDTLTTSSSKCDQTDNWWVPIVALPSSHSNEAPKTHMIISKKKCQGSQEVIIENGILIIYSMGILGISINKTCHQPLKFWDMITFEICEFLNIFPQFSLEPIARYGFLYGFDI